MIKDVRKFQVSKLFKDFKNGTTCKRSELGFWKNPCRLKHKFFQITFHKGEALSNLHNA